MPEALRPALQAASAATGAPRLLFVSGTSRDSKGPGALRSLAVGIGRIGAQMAPAQVALIALVVDAATGAVVSTHGWAGEMDGDNEDAVDAVARAVIFALFSGGDAAPSVFLPRSLRNRDATVRTHAGTSRDVRTRGLDGYTLVLSDSTRIPLESLRSIVTEPGGRGVLHRLR